MFQRGFKNKKNQFFYSKYIFYGKIIFYSNPNQIWIKTEFFGEFSG
jgi:hypothetical protein